MTDYGPVERCGYTITPEPGPRGVFHPSIHQVRISKNGLYALFPARLYEVLTRDDVFEKVAGDLFYQPEQPVSPDYEMPVTHAVAQAYARILDVAENVQPVVARERVIPMGEPLTVTAQPMPIPDTELDDEIEQILGRFLDDSLERIQARNQICAAITARGYDAYARRKKPE